MRTRPAALLVLLLAAALPGTASAGVVPTAPGADAAAEVVVVRGDGFADALTGGVLAGRRGAPLLLVPPTGALPEATRALLERRAGSLTTITVLGGESAVSSTVLAEALQAAGLR